MSIAPGTRRYHSSKMLLVNGSPGNLRLRDSVATAVQHVVAYRRLGSAGSAPKSAPYHASVVNRVQDCHEKERPLRATRLNWLHVVQDFIIKAMPVPRKAHYCKHNLDDQRIALGERKPRAVRKALETSIATRASSHDVYSRACTHSPSGDLSCDTTGPALQS